MSDELPAVCTQTIILYKHPEGRLEKYTSVYGREEALEAVLNCVVLYGEDCNAKAVPADAVQQLEDERTPLFE